MSKKIILIAILLLNSGIALAQEEKVNDSISKSQVNRIPDPGECFSGYGYIDNDGDGYGAGALICLDTVLEDIPTSTIGGDCNDNNPSVTIAQFWYQDLDGDGFGGASTSTKLCTAPSGYIGLGGDCNDTNSLINPNTIWYVDNDQDGFGSSATAPFVGCTPPIQTSYYTLQNNLDCDDNNALINPNTIWYFDADLDGFGNPAISLTQCAQPNGYILNNTDCNDNDTALNIVKTWYQDSDSDGFGNPALTLSSCTQPSGYVENNLDTCPTIAGSIQGCVVPNPSITYNSRNYIITTTPKIEVSNIQNISDAKDVVVNITYYDDLGKPNQQIASNQSANGYNIYTHIEYDQYNRQIKDYLPYSVNLNGIDFDSGAAFNVWSNGDYFGQNPYSEKLFESSPLNRTLKQAAPGTTNDWAMGSNHEIRFEYLTNILSTSPVKLYTATATWNATSGLFDISLSQSGNNYYTDNQLYRTITKDENWVSGKNNTVEEFKDKEGKVVLKRTYDAGVEHNTYYVYDQYNNLTYVIPPLVTSITTQLLNELCYQYKYDLRNRLVEKKLPGKQWEFIVYDKIDRVVATGPALSPFPDLTTSGWLITKYDVFNRPILTAWQQATVSSTTRTSLQASYNLPATIVSETKNTTTSDSPAINNVSCRYSNVVIPTSNYHTLTVNYYDDYNFSFAPTIPTTVESQTVFYNNTTKPKGLNTGSWVRVVENSTTVPVKSERNYSLFDSRARAIRTYKFNHLGGFTQVDSNFKPLTGRLEYSLTSHSRASLTAVITSKDEFTYSNQDRLLIQTNQINGGTKQLIASNSYNELGELISKYVGGTNTTGTSGLQKVDYSYNIRGWLTGINNDLTNNIVLNSTENDLFAFKINYATIEQNAPGVVPLFNGNISETYWRSITGNNLRKYGYKYDNLNRLKEAIYQKPDIINPVTNYFNESLTYDKNGNILTLIRNSASPLDAAPLLTIDNLTYTYQPNSNKLAKVSDNPATATSGFKDGTNTNDDYSYDANGNMTLDQNKGITAITYNHLNLPHKITFGTTGSITYLYNAVGIKVGKTVTILPLNVNSTTYLDGFQYLNNTLQFFPHAEGYVNAVGGYSYVFQYKDHLGNVRLSYADTAPVDGSISLSEIIEENNYYPFGLKHSGYNANVTSTNQALKYKYNGKELQDELGLNMYDYSARNYDSALGRWMNIDPLAEQSRRFSPYAYALNNPVYFIDPDGMRARKSEVVSDVIRFNGVRYGRGHWSDGIRMQSGALAPEIENSEEENNNGTTSQTKPPIDTGENIAKKFTRVLQKPNRFGCSWACKKSTDLFFNINPESIDNEIWLKAVQDHGASIDEIIALYERFDYNVNDFGFSDIHKMTFFDVKSIEWMADEIRNGRVVQIGWEPGKSPEGIPIQHNSIVTRVQYNYETQKLNLTIMNPVKYESQDVQRLLNLFKIFRIYSVWPN